MQIVPIRSRASARDRLLVLLDAEKRWSFLRAPAGFDKSGTVQGWLQANPRLLASSRWIEASSEDHVDAAALATLLAGQPPSKILVLDVTRVRHPLVLAALRVLGAHAQHVIVLARSAHVLPDHVPAMVDAKIIDSETLAYLPEEIMEAVPGVDAERSLSIREATTGWPVLVRLVASGRPQTSLNVAEIVEGFALELLTQLSPLAAEVIRTTCIVEAPDLALTAELSGLSREEAQQGWDEIIAEGLAATERSGSEPRTRIVPSVREAYLSWSREEHPDHVRELHQRAASWFAKKSQPVEAARHAIEAEDWDTALDVIEEASFILFAEHPDAIRKLVERIPSHFTANRPVSRILQDLLLRAGGPDAQPSLAATSDSQPWDVLGGEQAQGTMPAQDSEESLLGIGWREALRLRRGGDFTGSMAFGRSLHSRLADTARPLHSTARKYLPIFYLQSGITSMLAGNLVDAESELTNATRDGNVGFGAFAQRNAFADLALLAAIEGDNPRAHENLSRMAERPRIIGFFARVARFGELVAEAMVATDRLDLESARTAIDIAAESADRDELWAFYLLARARFAVAEGSAASALAEVASLRRTRRHLAGPDSAAAFLVPWAETLLLLATGQAARAGEVLNEAPMHPQLAGMRVLQRLQVGEPTEAIALAGSVLWTDEAGPLARGVGFLARAVAELQLDRHDDAAVSFRFAHTLIQRFEHRRYLGFFSRETIVSLSELTGLTLELDGIPQMLPTPASYAALTARELVVLTNLTTGATIAGIARTLFVSENTVRSQVRSLYRKLGVKSRDEAVAEAVRRGVTS